MKQISEKVIQLAEGISKRLYAKSVAFSGGIEGAIPKLIVWWIAIVAVASLLKVTFSPSPIDNSMRFLETIVPYLVVGLSPLVAWYLADRVFPHGLIMEQPKLRLARYGKWKALDCLTARKSSLFGPAGMMASLMLGMLLNIPLRTLEFMTAIPAMNANAPEWGQMIILAMTADLAIMNFIYVVAFVAALRNIPWFPRFLLLAWFIDISSQSLVAQLLTANQELPATVAAALSDLLTGNITKVLISMAIWLPYLILSERVNITYRLRTSAV